MACRAEIQQREAALIVAACRRAPGIYKTMNDSVGDLRIGREGLIYEEIHGGMHVSSGKWDDVRIDNWPLTADEILAVFGSGE